MLHIGTGADNGVVLSDPSLGDFHASISQQDSQLSLYANEAHQIRIGKTFIPGQQWVSVPPGATVHLGGQTEMRVVQDNDPAPLAPSAPHEEAAPTTERRRSPRKESKRQVARPVTARSDDTAVPFSAALRYPEFSLATGSGPAQPTAQPKESNPALLFTILAASCLSSAGLLLIDFEPSTVISSQDQATARWKLAAFYGTDSAQLEPYQKLLRQASVEHSQGHRSAERQLLKQVLGLLNSVDASAPENLNGLTGRQRGRGKASDKELHDLLQQVLN